MVGCEWFQIHKFDLYQDRSLKFMATRDKCIVWVTGGLSWGVTVLQWNLWAAFKVVMTKEFLFNLYCLGTASYWKSSYVPLHYYSMLLVKANVSIAWHPQLQKSVNIHSSDENIHIPWIWGVQHSCTQGRIYARAKGARAQGGISKEIEIKVWYAAGPAFGWGERGTCPGRWLRGGAEKAVTDRPHVNTKHFSMVISSFANEKSRKGFLFLIWLYWL
jgi:hypothetical protein